MTDTSKRIFIVEDEPLARFRLEHQLSEMGYNVCGSAHTGELALKSIPAAEPDLVLMDVRVGWGTSALAVAEELQKTADVPVVYLTTPSDEDWVRRALQTSFAFVNKPVVPQTLSLNLEMAMQRHRAERALRESERRYRTLFNDSIEGMFRSDANGVLQDVNPALASMLEYSAESELIGMEISSLFEEPSKWQIFAERAKYGVAHTLQTFKQKNGKSLWVRLSGRAIYESSGQVIQYQGYVIDHSELRESQERQHQLLKTNEQLELVIEGTRLGFWDWNPKTGKVLFSERCAEMLGMSLDQLSDTFKLLESRIHPDDQAVRNEAIKKHIQDKTPYYESVYRVRHADGRWLFILDRGRIFLRESAGEPTRFCGTLTDITAEREASRSAHQADEAKRFFIANMSHDLRTPLNAILGLSQALLETTQSVLTDKQRGHLQTVYDSGKHLLETMNDVIDLSRIEAGKLVLDTKEFSINSLMGECIAVVYELAEAHDIVVKPVIDPAVTHVCGDRLRVKQAIVNTLLTVIKIGVKSPELEVGIQRSQDGRYVEFSVVNRNTVLTNDEMERIFEPFGSTHKKFSKEQHSTGLGMALAKRIVELHGGCVCINRDGSPGMTLTLKLPRAHKDEAQSSLTTII